MIRRDQGCSLTYPPPFQKPQRILFINCVLFLCSSCAAVNSLFENGSYQSGMITVCILISNYEPNLHGKTLLENGGNTGGKRNPTQRTFIWLWRIFSMGSDQYSNIFPFIPCRPSTEEVSPSEEQSNHSCLWNIFFWWIQSGEPGDFSALSSLKEKEIKKGKIFFSLLSTISLSHHMYHLQRPTEVEHGARMGTWIKSRGMHGQESNVI